MRFVLLAFMLCVTSTAALARNGETGILIAVPDFSIESVQERAAVRVTDSEWISIHKVLAEGLQAQVELGDLGTYEALEDQLGAVHLVHPTGDHKILLPESAPTEGDAPVAE